MVAETRNAASLRRIDPQNLIGAAAALSIGLLIAAIVTSYFMFLQTSERESWVAHTLVVQRSTSEMLADILQAESSLRGFVITGEEPFLEPYKKSRESFYTELERLRDLTKDNLRQTQRMNEIHALSLERFQFLDDGIARVRRGELTGQVGTIKSGRGKALGDQITAIVNELKADEDALLATRAREADQSRAVLSTVIIAAIALSFVAAAFAVYLVRARLINLAANRNVLEARVTERTAELESAKRQAETEAARASREQERVELLLRDLNHRVGNNLATISALLGLQVNRLPAGASRNAIESARNRIGAIGIAQRRLRLGEDLQTTRLDEFFNNVLSDMFEAIPGTERLTLVRNFQPLQAGSRDAITLSVVMNELITNALKHAFPGGRSGTINVSLAIEPDGVPVMSVADDGVGSSIEIGTEGTGLGATVVDRMSQQYGGTVIREANHPSGTKVTITMPRLRAQPVGG